MRVLFAAAISLLMVCGGAFGASLAIDPTYAGDKDKLRAVQTDLTAAGYAIGKADGNFTAKSQAAFQSFLKQYATNLPLELNETTATRLSHLATMLSTPPWDVAPADYGVLRKGAQFVWDDRQQKTTCPATKCILDFQLLAVGDLTGDGIPELVYGTYPSDLKFAPLNVAAPIVILTRGSNGQYSILPVKTDDPSGMVARVHPRIAIIRDFNGDGIGDLFVAAHGYDRPPFPAEQNVLLLSSPDGLVDRSHTSLPVQNDFAHGVDAADLDGDGDQDMIVVTNWGKTQIEPYVLWNDGKGKFTQARLDTILDRDLALFLAPGIRSHSEYITLNIVDVDKDGNLDLVLCTSGDNATKTSSYPGLKYTRIVYGDGSGKWTSKRVTELPASRWGYGTYTTDARVLDIDGDGDNDIVLSLATSVGSDPKVTQWGGQYVQVLRNENGVFVDDTGESMFPQKLDEAHVAFPVQLDMADLNGDGSPDITILNRDPWVPGHDQPERRSVMMALNDGKGHFTRIDPAQWKADTFTGQYLGAADLDGDGDTDIVGVEPLVDPQAPDWHPYGFIVTTYENTGKPINPPLKFRKPVVTTTSTTEQISHSEATDTDANSLFETVFHDKAGNEVHYQYNVVTSYSAASRNMDSFLVVINVPIGAQIPDALAACRPDTKAREWDGQQHPVVEFERRGDDFAAVDLDCVAAALPKPLGDQARYLGQTFQTIATDMAASGNADAIQNDGLRAWIGRIGAGEIKVLPK